MMCSIKPYLYESYCPFCQKDTLHKHYESGHERDSSNDWRKCLTCGATWSGYTGKYELRGMVKDAI